MRESSKNHQSFFEKTNPVFNTAKTTLFQLARLGDPYAAAISEQMGLTEDTQKSRSFSMSPEEEATFRIVLETRYHMMGALARNSGFPVLADLPCGYTPRAVETAERGMAYIGLDLPAVISEISSIVPPLISRKKRSLVRFAAVDATNSRSLDEALGNVKERICINTEGLLMYFTDAEIHAFLDNIRKQLDTHGGCWITADPEIVPEHKRILNAIHPGVSERGTHHVLKEKADLGSPENALLIRFGHEKEDIRKALGILSDHGLKAERIRIAGFLADTKAFSLLSPDQGSAVLKAVEDIAFWKVVSAGPAGDRTEAGRRFSVRSELAGGVLEIRLTGRLDSLTAPRLLAVYEERKASCEIRKVLADCRSLDYISSAGLRVLLIMLKDCAEGVRLTGVNSTVADILNQSGFSMLMDVQASAPDSSSC